MTIDEMLAREAIRYTIELYNRNADSADYDRHVDVFLPDAVIAVQGREDIKGVHAIIAALKAGAERRHAYDQGNFQRHNLTSVMIEMIEDGRASVRTYVIVITEKGLDHFGHYDDIFVRAGDRWMIERREASSEWFNPQSRFFAWLNDAKAFHQREE